MDLPWETAFFQAWHSPQYRSSVTLPTDLTHCSTMEQLETPTEKPQASDGTGAWAQTSTVMLRVTSLMHVNVN